MITLDKVNQKLLDRLANAAKENDQLQSRLEEAVSNLEQAEANNRTLLVTLESGMSCFVCFGKRFGREGFNADHVDTRIIHRS